MATPTLGPCSPWADDSDLCSSCADYSLDPTLLEDFFEQASFILYYASAQQFPNTCERTIRPCSRRVFDTYAALYPNLSPWTIRWAFPWNIACGCRDYNSCSCTSLAAIELPDYPVDEISEVKVDGLIIPSSDYRVDAYKYLVRTDGESWPCCQDLTLPDTSPDTFSVSYSYGYPVPAAGRHAAAVLACELYLACQPEDAAPECRLPRNIASLARQGVAMAFQLVDELFSPRNGKPVSFGIPEIDTFLAVTNPHGLSAPIAILSPDDPDLARQVDTGGS